MPPATVSGSIRRTSPPGRSPSPMRCGPSGVAGSSCRRPCRSAKARWPRFSGGDADAIARACAEAPASCRRASYRRPTQCAGAGGHRRACRCRRTSGRAGQGRRREASDSARRKRPVPLCADEARRGAARARTPRACRRRIPPSRSSRTSMLSLKPRRCCDRCARPAGVVTGEMGRRREAADRRRCHDICRAGSRKGARRPGEENRSQCDRSECRGPGRMGAGSWQLTQKPSD